MQLLTKAGALNVPEWYDAGKVAVAEGGPASFADLSECGPTGIWTCAMETGRCEYGLTGAACMGAGRGAVPMLLADGFWGSLHC